MRKYKFNLKLPVSGLDYENYKIVELGDKYAKINGIRDLNGIREFVLSSKHKRYDFSMEIESIWHYNKSKKEFKIKRVFVEIDIFDILVEPFTLPQSHINTLKKWLDEQSS